MRELTAILKGRDGEVGMGKFADELIESLKQGLTMRRKQGARDAPHSGRASEGRRPWRTDGALCRRRMPVSGAFSSEAWLTQTKKPRRRDTGATANESRISPVMTEAAFGFSADLGGK